MYIYNYNENNILPNTRLSLESENWNILHLRERRHDLKVIEEQ